MNDKSKEKISFDHLKEINQRPLLAVGRLLEYSEVDNLFKGR